MSRPGISKERVEAVIEAKGELPITSILRGAVFGITDFVKAVFEFQKEKPGRCREIGARPMKGGIRRGELWEMHDLRGEAIG
ncbi:MAG: hypothetical protein ACKVJU_23275 [Verrucomicrobiales bacterium]